MPFTFIHPSIFVPFKDKIGKFFIYEALLTGTLAPDFEYFIRPGIIYDFGHTFTGVFLFDLPVSIFIFFIYQFVIKKVLMMHLPRPVDSWNYINQFDIKKFDFRKVIIILISLLIGIFSHLFWDSFTHWDGFFVKSLPEISNMWIDLIFFKFKLYRFLQHGCTIAGFIILAYFFYKRRNKSNNCVQKIRKTQKFIYWFLLFSMTIIFYCLRNYIEFNSIIPNQLWFFVIFIISGFLISLTLISLLFRLMIKLK